MNNLKKIGLTALAGSLVVTSVAYAGELTVSGSAGMKVENSSNSSAGKTVGMDNNIYFKGSGETDSGLNVNLSFELDDGSSSGNASGVWDNHSVSVGNDTIGTLTVHGHGGSNSASALDTTAAGDLWDNGSLVPTANQPDAARSSNNLVVYSLPSVVEDLSLAVSYDSDGNDNEGSTAFGATYTGVEGLSLSFGNGNDAATAGVSIDQTVMKASYAYGSFTMGASLSEYDHTTGTNDQEVRSYGISYTLTDQISLSYGTETFERQGTAADVEVDGVSASYTSGGMTLGVSSYESKNVDHTTDGTDNDNSYWKLSLGFAF
jgi:outer membrane protein OmpU